MNQADAPPPTDQAAGGRYGKAGAFAALFAVIGAATAIVVPETQRWEGREYVAYRDIVNVLTICDGDTTNVREGQRADDAECDSRLVKGLVAHAKPVMRCVPGLADPERLQQRAASVVFAYNIGPTGYCGSSAARRFNVGDWRGGCEAILLWNKAAVPANQVERYRKRGEVCKRQPDGRWLCTVRGLTNRREAERKICLKGLS